MEQRVKQRLIGAVILVALGVIFIPMLLQGPVEREHTGIPVEIPPRSQMTPKPDIPKADALDEATPGQQLTERPPPARAAARRASAAPFDQRRPSSAVSQSSAKSQRQASGHETTGATVAAAWAVQVGSFRDRDNAENMREALRQGGFSSYIEQTRYKHKPLFRVRVGPLAGRAEAEQLAARLHKQRGIKGLVVGK